MARQRYYRPSARCCRVLHVSADRAARPGPHTRGKPRLLDVGRRIPERDRFAPDSPLEGDGFEPSVPRQKDNAFRASPFQFGNSPSATGSLSRGFQDTLNHTGRRSGGNRFYVSRRACGARFGARMAGNRGDQIAAILLDPARNQDIDGDTGKRRQ